MMELRPWFSSRRQSSLEERHQQAAHATRRSESPLTAKSQCRSWRKDYLLHRVPFECILCWHRTWWKMNGFHENAWTRGVFQVFEWEGVHMSSLSDKRVCGVCVLCVGVDFVFGVCVCSFCVVCKWTLCLVCLWRFWVWPATCPETQENMCTRSRSRDLRHKVLGTCAQSLLNLPSHQQC